MATRILIFGPLISERIARNSAYRRYIRYELKPDVHQWCAEHLVRHRLVTKRQRSYRAKHFIEVATDAEAVKFRLRWGSET
jgi:hypothetical protein